MSSSLVVAIIVVVGAALTISYALKSNDSTGGADPSSGSPPSSLSSAEVQGARIGMVGGCENAGGPSSYCECLADQMIAAGYDTIGEMTGLGARIEEASRTGDTSALPADVAAADGRCAGLIR
jgi:hypothetical protein